MRNDRKLPSTAQLEAMPTLLVSHTCDLKFDDGEVRLFLSRCDTGDGEPFDHTGYIEIKDVDGRWIDQGYYDADCPPEALPGVTGTYFLDFKVDAERNIDAPASCHGCQRDIDWDDEGGHIHPDGSVLCPQCDETEHAKEEDQQALQALTNFIVFGTTNA